MDHPFQPLWGTLLFWQTCISNTRLAPAQTLCYGINPKPLCLLLPAWETVPLCVFMNLLIFRVNVVTGSLCRFYVLTELSLKSDNPFQCLKDGDLLSRPWLRQAMVSVLLHSPNPPSTAGNCRGCR